MAHSKKLKYKIKWTRRRIQETKFSKLLHQAVTSTLIGDSE
jgi:hypothetical protein